MATGTCLPELCACGSSAQRKLAQRQAAKPAEGGTEGSAVAAPLAESKEHRAATKTGEDAAIASRAHWEELAKERAATKTGEDAARAKAGKDAATASRDQWEELAKERAVAEENELGMREAMDKAREGSSSIRSTGASSSAEGGVNWASDRKGGKDAVHSMADVNWAKDDAERTAKATARELKVRQAQDLEDAETEASNSAAAKMDKPCVSLLPSMPHDWCASTCARGDCPAAICRCGDRLAAQGLGLGVRPKAAAVLKRGCVSVVSDATDAWCVALCAMPDVAVQVSRHEPARGPAVTCAGQGATDSVADSDSDSDAFRRYSFRLKVHQRRRRRL